MIELDAWVECWNCAGEVYSHHDCGEDVCCCLMPEDNVVCDVCHGKGGWKASSAELLKSDSDVEWSYIAL
jgi:hypothetical protein